MTDFQLIVPYPNAVTAWVFGRVASVDHAALSGFESALWFVDAASAAAAPLRAGTKIEVVIVDPVDPSGARAAMIPSIHRTRRLLPTLLIADVSNADVVQAYDWLLHEGFELLEAEHRARLTIQHDGMNWQANLLKNLPVLATRPLPATWAGAARGVPAFVVGAGPSLDATLPRLAAQRDQGLVFAADSALVALGRASITADFAVTIDQAKVPERCLPPGTPLPGCMVAAGTSPPAWAQAIPPERQVWVASRQITEPWLYSLGITKPAITVTESCGSTALEVAVLLGCSPIHLIGIDLAVDQVQPAVRHAWGADPELYRKSNYNPTAKLPEVPGNYQPTVPCFAYGDWKALSARVASLEPGRIVNVTDRGARLTGATLVHPRDWTMVGPPVKRPELLAAWSTSGDGESARAAAFAVVRGVAKSAAGVIPRLRERLASGGPAAVVPALRGLALDPELSRLLGAATARLMPHLFPPIEGDVTVWSERLDEIEGLVAIAAGLGGGS